MNTLRLDGAAARAALCLDAIAWGADPDTRERQGHATTLRFGDLDVTLGRTDEGAIPSVTHVTVAGATAHVDLDALTHATTLRALARGPLSRCHIPILPAR